MYRNMKMNILIQIIITADVDLFFTNCEHHLGSILRMR